MQNAAAHSLPRILPPLLGAGSSFLELAPTPPQLTKGKLCHSTATSRRPARPRLSACNCRGSGIVFNTDMGGGGLYSTWHYYSVLHILLSFGMLLFWWLMFFFPYRVLFFQGGR